MTAGALLGFSCSGAFWLLLIGAIPYGLGAGAVDAALNNYVALHYASKHMNWLHCFWGVGASISPFIMSHALTGGLGWFGGYRTVGIIQIVLSRRVPKGLEERSMYLWRGVFWILFGIIVIAADPPPPERSPLASGASPASRSIWRLNRSRAIASMPKVDHSLRRTS